VPQINKNDISLQQQYNELKKEEARLVKEIQNDNLKDTAKTRERTRDIKEYRVKLKEVQKQMDSIVSSTDDMVKGLGKSVKEVSKVGAEAGNLGGFFKDMAKEASKAGKQFALLGDELADAMISGDKSKVKLLNKVFEGEDKIMDVMKSKSAFMNADLDTMLEQAKTNLENGKLTKNLSRNAKNLLKQQVQQLKTMKAQQSISKKLADNYGDVSGFVDKIKDGFEMLKASPLAAVIIGVLGVMEKMVGKVEAAAKAMNAEVGIGLVNSVKEAGKQMAAMPASSIMESMGLAPQVAKRAREAATIAAATGGDLALMQNMAIGINEAVAELDYGIAASQVAELADNLFVTTNLTREQASAALNSTAEFARQNKVAPKKVLEDMAQNAQVLAKFSDGTAEGMARAAVQAARLGLELSAVGQVMDGLLNLESSIASEFEASVLLGKELNLDRARTLALNNDMEGAMKEIVKQVGSEAEFQQMNAIQRQSLADAVGLSTDQLAQMMKKGGRAQLEGSVPEKQLKNLDDLRVSAGIQEGFLSRIATLVSGILSFLLAGKGLSLLGDIASMFRGRGRGFFRDRARRTRGGRSVFDRAMQMKKSRAARAPRGPGIIDKMKGRGSNLMKRLSQSKFATKATQIAGKGTKLAGGAIQSVKGGIGAIGGSAFKMLGRVALPLAAAADALYLGSEMTKENATTESKTKAVGSVAGGWAGAAGGAKAGALIGAMAGPLGAAVGGVLGGAVGYVAGSKFGEAIANPIRGTVSAGMDYLGPKMDQAMNKAKEFGVSLGNDISNIKSKASEFGSKVVEFGGTVKGKLSSGLNTARGKINELSSAVGKNLVGAVGKAKSKISSMMSSIKSKAASLASSAKSTASSALNAAANFMGFKAAGGPVYKSGTYMVGERGPELVHLSRGSTVVPNHQIQGGAAQGAGGDLVAELRALRTELDKIAANTARGANAAERTKIGSAA
tara:strand:+ start:10555 stop:13440 length:2886 start_codon:yes stop_codon:yes gene_type:complete